MSETTTENQNAEVSENTENPENATNSENAPENAAPETPAFEMPTLENIDFGDPFLTGLGTTMLTEIQSIKTIDALLERQKSDFAEEKLIDVAKDSDNAEIKAIYAQYEKTVARLKDLTTKLVGKVTEEIGADKLSEDEIKAKREERKGIIDTVKSSQKVLTHLVDQGMAGENKEYISAFLENLEIPGTRNVSTSGTTAASGTPKPRLNGGGVTVNGERHPNFPVAANAVGKILGKEVSTSALINAWVDSQNVSDWKEISELSEFKYDTVTVHVHKMPKGNK